jgi:Zinc carboxypeptidase
VIRMSATFRPATRCEIRCRPELPDNGSADRAGTGAGSGVAACRWSLVAALLMAVTFGHAATAFAWQRGRGQAAQRQPLVRSNGTIDWNRYYSSAETTTILRELARRNPKLTELYSIGKSFKGADLMVIEITNEETGKAADKPALYVDGGIRAGELTGSAVALYLVNHLLANYGKDTRITQLLDTRAFYIRPKFNPDGADLVLLEDQQLRSSVRPWDDDGDGVADEDPPEDLNKDGWITQMRVRHRNGDWKQGADPRLLVRREPGDTVGPFYFVSVEGIDNDHDGKFNEDGIGGIDLDRNFPRNWEPEYVQEGAGPAPLSEPETYATTQFILQHPNIAGIVHGHTAGGFVYRLPSSSDPARFDRTDLALIEELGRGYTESTGRPVRASSTDATDHRYGTLIGWAYDVLGIIGWVPEYSPPDAWIPDADGDGRISDVEALKYNDEKLGGKYFSPWTRFAHSQLGEVEIGGWHTKFWGQNPPAEHLADECRIQMPWIMSLLERSPRIELGRLRVLGQADGRVRVQVEVSNTGFLPTNMTERGATGRQTDHGTTIHQIVRPPVATVNVTGGAVDGPATILLNHIAGTNTISKAAREKSVTISWTLRKTAAELRVSVSVDAGPGGVARSAEAVYR